MVMPRGHDQEVIAECASASVLNRVASLPSDGHCRSSYGEFSIGLSKNLSVIGIHRDLQDSKDRVRVRETPLYLAYPAYPCERVHDGVYVVYAASPDSAACGLQCSP